MPEIFPLRFLNVNFFKNAKLCKIVKNPDTKNPAEAGLMDIIIGE